MSSERAPTSSVPTGTVPQPYSPHKKGLQGRDDVPRAAVDLARLWLQSGICHRRRLRNEAVAGHGQRASVGRKSILRLRGSAAAAGSLRGGADALVVFGQAGRILRFGSGEAWTGVYHGGISSTTYEAVCIICRPDVPCHSA